MWKNKELCKFFCLTIAMNFVFFSITLILYPEASWLVAILCLGLDSIFYFFTMRRYQELKHLSSYLMQVYTGNSILDIRDNQEGELSVLKNDIYKVTQTLQNQAELLRKDKLFLADTLSDISHQLKTPLTSMKVLSELLQDETLPVDKKKLFLQQMQTQLERMQWLITALLKLSRIDANAVVFKQEQISLHSLIQKSTEPFFIPMELKEITFTNEIPDNILLLGDENWLVEAFTNILKNAVEHTFVKGNIHISCVDNPLHTKLFISNTGEPIEEKDQMHIFDRFYKGKQATSDSIGIGLALSKTIFQHLQGQITCESNPKVTTFIVTFYKHVV